MAILDRRLSDDSVAGHIEVESREKSRQSCLIRRRSRNPVSYPGLTPLRARPYPKAAGPRCPHSIMAIGHRALSTFHIGSAPSLRAPVRPLPDRWFRLQPASTSYADANTKPVVPARRRHGKGHGLLKRGHPSEIEEGDQQHRKAHESLCE